MKLKLKENLFFIALTFFVFLGFFLNHFFREMSDFLYNLDTIKDSLDIQKNGRDFQSFWYAFHVFPDILIYLCAIAGGVLLRRNASLWLFEFYRKKSYRKQLFQKIVGNSVRFSVALFIAFLFYLEFLNVLSQGSIVNNLGGGSTLVAFLVDCLPMSFISQHVFVYELLFGVYYCLLAGFVYSFLAQCVALYFTDVKTYFSTWILVTFGYCHVLGSLTQVELVGKIAKLFLLVIAMGQECSTVGMLLALLVPLFIGGTLLFTRKKREVGGVARSFSFAISFNQGKKHFAGRQLSQKYRVAFWGAVVMSGVNLYREILYGTSYVSDTYGGIMWLLLQVIFLVFSHRNMGMIQYELAFHADKRRFFIQKMKDYAMKWAFFFLLYGVGNFFMLVLFVQDMEGLDLTLQEIREINLSVLLVYSLAFFVFFNLLYLFVLSGILKKNYAVLPYLLCVVFWKTGHIFPSLAQQMMLINSSSIKKIISIYLNPLGVNYFHFSDPTRFIFSILSINWLPYLLMVVCYTFLGIFVIWYRNRKLEVN